MEIKLLNALYTFPIVVAISFPIVFALLIIHLYQYYKYELSQSSQNEKRNKSISYKVMSILTNLTLFGFTFNILFGGLQHILCHILFGRLTVIFYSFAKCCMYLIFILRLHYVYSKSIYSLNITILKICSILLIIIYLFLTIYGFITVTNDAYQGYSFGHYVKYCPMLLGLLYIFFALITDIICTIVSLIAFMLPLIKILNSLTEKYGKTYNSDDLKYPIIKITILTSVASISTLLSHTIAAIIQNNIIFGVDSPINCVCVILMTSYYPKTYDKLCCGLIKCIYFFDKKNEFGFEDNKQQPIDIDPTTNGDEQDLENTMNEPETRTMGTLPSGVKYETQSELTHCGDQ